MCVKETQNDMLLICGVRALPPDVRCVCVCVCMYMCVCMCVYGVLKVHSS